MECPYCRQLDSHVVDSRLIAAGTVTWRRRECDSCSRRYTTYERVEHVIPIVVKKNGHREPFDRQKVLHGMQLACNKRLISMDTLEGEAAAIERELSESGDKEIPSQEIGNRVMARLKTLDGVAYVRFASVYRSFRDIDEFMAEMSNLVRSTRTPE